MEEKEATVAGNGQGTKTGMWLVGEIFAAGIMSFAGVVSETAMNVTFPTLMEDFSIGTSTVQWLTTGYLLVLALVITMSSYLNRNFTIRRLFFCAILLFIFATLLCAIAPNFWTLLGGRLLQGAGTGIALPLMYNIILAQAPKNQLGMYMGIASFVSATAPAVGPVLGGFIVDQFGWRFIFWMLIPLLLISLLLGAWTIQGGQHTERSRFHFFDYMLIVIGFSCFIFATVRSSVDGWQSLGVGVLLLTSVIALSLFIYRSKKEENPLLNIDVFRFRPFVLGLVSILAIQCCVLSLGYIIPNYSQIVSGTNAFVAGSLLLPGCIVGAFIAPVSGRLLDKFGPARPILFGNLLIFFSLILFCLYGMELTRLMFTAFYVCYTIGQGFCVGNTMTYGLAQLPPDIKADGNALLNSFQQLAGAIGTAVAATLVATAQNRPGAVIAQATALGSWHTFLLLLVLSLISFYCTWRMFAKR